jgi:hypothetical protein
LEFGCQFPEMRNCEIALGCSLELATTIQLYLDLLYLLLTIHARKALASGNDPILTHRKVEKSTEPAKLAGKAQGVLVCLAATYRHNLP